MSAETPIVYPNYGCAGADLSLLPDLTGVLDLRADGSYTFDVGVEVTFSYAIPAACTYGYACEDLTYYVGANSCTRDGSDGCLCVGDVADGTDASQDAGAWEAIGVQIAFDGLDGPSDADYCVDGEVLRLLDPATGTGIGLTRR